MPRRCRGVHPAARAQGRGWGGRRRCHRAEDPGVRRARRAPFDSGISALREKAREEIDDRGNDPARALFLLFQFFEFLVGEGSGIFLFGFAVFFFFGHIIHSFCSGILNPRGLRPAAGRPKSRGRAAFPVPRGRGPSRRACRGQSVRVLNSRTVLSPFSVQTTLPCSSWEKVTSKGASPSNSPVAETVSVAAS